MFGSDVMKTLAILAAWSLSGAALAQGVPPIGPPAVAVADPTEVARRAQVEASITDALIDPDSAKFKWLDRTSVALTKYRAGIFGKTITGNLLMECGRVNSKNRMGGYVGFRWFAVVFKDGVIVSSDLDSDDDVTPSSDVCKSLGL